MFISFEGGEGSGKSTQAEMLVKCLVAAGMQVVPVREPGSTSLGQHLRRYLKDESVSLTSEAELLLFCAARAQLVAEVLGPSLIHGIQVVADRYADSTVAYQGYGRGLDLDVVDRTNNLATAGLRPDLTFLLDVDPVVGLARVQSQVGMPMDAVPQRESALVGSAPVDSDQLSLFPIGVFTMELSLPGQNEAALGRQDEEGQRGFEVEPLAFHRRVRRGYLELAEKEPERWVVLDASQPKSELARQIWEEVQARLGSSDPK